MERRGSAMRESWVKLGRGEERSRRASDAGRRGVGCCQTNTTDGLETVYRERGYVGNFEQKPSHDRREVGVGNRKRETGGYRDAASGVGECSSQDEGQNPMGR
eukprot:755857-Hanusia_phi.AAC.5